MDQSGWQRWPRIDGARSAPSERQCDVAAPGVNADAALIDQAKSSRSDVRPHYECNDVFVLPSLTEGISNTVLGAMGSGLTVIASAVGGNVELVQRGSMGTSLRRPTRPCSPQRSPGISTIHH